MVSRQSGFSLVELMVALAASLVVVAGIISIFSGVVRSNADSLRHTRLTQELRSTMDFISAELRRAGYQDNIAPGDENTHGIHEVSNNCVRYSYDAPDNQDYRAFRFRNNQVEWRRSNASFNSCNGGTPADWEAITDANTIFITNASNFADQSLCINRNNGTDCNKCNPGFSAWAVNDELFNLRQLSFTLSGYMLNDPNDPAGNKPLILDNEIQIMNANTGVALTNGNGANAVCGKHIRVTVPT